MYKNLTISRKMMIGFAAVIFLAAITVSVSVFSLSNIGKLMDRMFEGPYVLSSASMGLRRDLNMVGNSMRSAIIEKNVAKYDVVLNEADQLIADRMQLIQSSYEGDPALLEELKSNLQVLSGQRQLVVTALEAQD